MSDEDAPYKPPAAILALYLNYGNLLDERGFDTLVCDFADAGVIAIPETHWIN